MILQTEKQYTHTRTQTQQQKPNLYMRVQCVTTLLSTNGEHGGLKVTTNRGNLLGTCKCASTTHITTLPLLPVRSFACLAARESAPTATTTTTMERCTTCNTLTDRQHASNDFLLHRVHSHIHMSLQSKYIRYISCIYPTHRFHYNMYT